MPNLAFSPGPQQPPAPPTPISGGEKENASSGSKSLLADPSQRHCSSGTSGVGPGGRAPLENLSPDGEGVSATAPAGSAATSSAGGGAVAAAVVCLRNSSCKCRDCDMAASVFDIGQLRQVGSRRGNESGDDAGDSGGDGGGVASSPTSGAPDKNGSVAMAHTPPNGGSPTTTTTTTATPPAETVTVPATPTPAAAAASPGDEAEPATAPPAAAGTPPAIPAAATPAPRVAIASPSVEEEVAATPTSAARSDGRRGSAEGGAKVETPAAAVAVDEAAGTGAAEVDSGSGKKKGVGWGFRMARAVFSPGVRLSPGKYLSVCGGGASQIVEGQEAGAGEDEGGKGAAGGAGAREEEVSAPPSSASATSADGLTPVPLSNGGTVGGGSGGGGSRRSSIGGKMEGETLLSDCDDDENEGPAVEGGEEEEAEVAAAGGTCRPPSAAATAAAVAPAGIGAATEGGVFDVSRVYQGGGGGGKGVPRRVSGGGRRLSKDVFFECSSEAERVVASSDSENSDGGRHFDDDQSDLATVTTTSTTKTPTSAGILSSAFPLSGGTIDNASSENAASAAAAPADATAVAAGGGGGGSALVPPPSLRLAARGPDPAAAAAVEAAVAAAAAAAASAGSASSSSAVAAAATAATVTGDHALPALSADHLAALGGDAAGAGANPVLANWGGRGVNVARADAGQGEGQPDGAGRNVPTLGRRRNRRAGARLELGMVGAYGHEDDMAKFSQSEVNAMIKERLAEEQGAFDKTLSSLKETHAMEMQAAAQELQRSSSDGNRAKIAARDAEALEREIAMLSERYGEAASEARSTGKALREKEALLDAVTNQLMGLKADLANVRAEHNEEKEAIREAAEDERRLRCAAEGSLAQLEAAYNQLEDSEREKRAAGILKMKKDMQALAQAQFGEANKKYNAMKAKLDAYEVEMQRLKDAAQVQDAQVKEARQHAEELKLQMASAQKEHADSAAEASRREHLLQDELDALREESEARLDEMDAIARERDSANTGRDVSQDALARMAIRNTQLKETVADLEGKVKELEGFCTEALDELDQEKANSAALAAAVGRKG